MPKKRPTFLLMIIMNCSALPLLAQFDAQASSPIWGNSGETQCISSPLHNDPNWSVLPSEQTLNPGQPRNSSSNRGRQYRNSNNQPILTDAQGNIITDVYGNPVIDSTSSSYQGSASGGMSADADGITPPPDDPVDVPIDGGVGILLAIGLMSGYNQVKTKRKLV